MTAPAPVATPAGGLELTIDRIVVRGAGPVSPAAVEAAVARALAASFAPAVEGGAAEPMRVRRIGQRVEAGALANADGIAATIGAAVTGQLRGERR